MAGQDNEMGLGLPPELLAKIFAFLPEQDRLKAAPQTCRLWREVCLLPQFWRDQSFSITGLCDDSRIKQRKMWMKIVGPHMQHLTVWLDIKDEELDWINYYDYYDERISYECRELFKTIPSKLLTFKCHGLSQLWLRDLSSGYQISHNVFTVSKIFTALSRMLARQECLTDVVFTHSYNSTPDNYNKILRVLANADTASHLKTLIFHYFDQRVNEWPVFSELMGKLPALETLGLCYTYMNDNVLDQITSGSPLLTRLILYMDGGDLHQYLPPTPDWHTALQSVPQLRVGINIFFEEYSYDEEFHVDFATVSLPDLPVRSICLDCDPYYITPITFMDVVTADAILNVTYNIRGTRELGALEAIILKLPRSGKRRWQRSKELADFVQACPSLTLLCLQMDVTMNVVLKVAAAARPRAEKGAEEGGSSAPRGTPLATPKLHIHVSGCDRTLKEVQQRLSVVSPLTEVHICNGCQVTAV